MKKGLITSGRHLPYNPALRTRVRELRNNRTPGERKLWYDYLKDLRYPVSRRRPIDGDTHCTDVGKVYDARRTQILESYGLTVLRFTNVDVTQSFEGVCQEIERSASLRLVDGFAADAAATVCLSGLRGENPLTPFT